MKYLKCLNLILFFFLFNHLISLSAMAESVFPPPPVYAEKVQILRKNSDPGRPTDLEQNELPQANLLEKTPLVVDAAKYTFGDRLIGIANQGYMLFDDSYIPIDRSMAELLAASGRIYNRLFGSLVTIAVAVPNDPAVEGVSPEQRLLKQDPADLGTLVGNSNPDSGIVESSSQGHAPNSVAGDNPQSSENLVANGASTSDAAAHPPARSVVGNEISGSSGGLPLDPLSGVSASGSRASFAGRDTEGVGAPQRPSSANSVEEVSPAMQHYYQIAAEARKEAGEEADRGLSSGTDPTDSESARDVVPER